MYSRAGIFRRGCLSVCLFSQCSIDENRDIKFPLNLIKNTCIAVNEALLYNTNKD